ncbi:MAG TPA: translation elongation factor Ts [Planctomycetota bacterium]|nr:translation elongation factor Ts [Planctomycetota bacterium]
MSAISAADVGKLRAHTGAGLMDCKKALQESGGDYEKAVDWLRKRGMQIAAKKADREIKAGAVLAEVTEGGKLGVLLEVGCETDFVARNDDFQKAAKALVAHIAKTAPADAAALKASSFEGTTVEEAVKALSAKTGENVQLGRFARYQAGPNGGVFSYLHFTGTLGVLLELEADQASVIANEETQTLAKELCLHIAFAKPVGLTREAVPADVIAREREVYAQSDALKGKPENMISKIIDGKMEAFFKERCLIDQGWVKDDKKKIRDLVAETGKKAGGKLEIKRFDFFAVGGK